MEIYTDGACHNNGQSDARGAWAYYVPSASIERSGRLPQVEFGTHTNQKAELYAILQALQYARDIPVAVCIYSDSDYSIKCVTQWIGGWKRNGWRTAKGEPVKNQSLIRAIDHEMSVAVGIRVFKHVAGHAGVHGNEVCDTLCRRVLL